VRNLPGYKELVEGRKAGVCIEKPSEILPAMEQIPDKLLERLVPGGILIAPVGPHHGTQTLVRVVRTDSGFDRKELVDVRFVPALPGIAREL
jgi:protein-L-isoaspartate(D-aspartate) O-methyltransferase